MVSAQSSRLTGAVLKAQEAAETFKSVDGDAGRSRQETDVSWMIRMSSCFMIRNGIRQKVTVFSPIGTDGADGTIDQGNEMKKALGYNGPVHNSTYGIFAMDNVALLNHASTQDEVLELFEETQAFDRQTLVDADAEAYLFRHIPERIWSCLIRGQTAAPLPGNPAAKTLSQTAVR